MGILDKLKKGKKDESVLDALIKKKTSKDEPSDVVHESSDDIEVRELSPSEKGDTTEEVEEVPDITEFEKPVREFRTSGMHEFELDSLGADSDANVKVEYKVRITTLIDQGKIDEAIQLLGELKAKLAEKD